jgi:hypothetical protein
VVGEGGSSAPWTLRDADGTRVGEIESSASWTVAHRDADEFLTSKEN